MKRLKSDDGLEIGAAADATTKANAARDAAIAAAAAAVPVKSVNGLTGDVVISAPVPSYSGHLAFWQECIIHPVSAANLYIGYYDISCDRTARYVLAARGGLDYSLDFGFTWQSVAALEGHIIQLCWVTENGDVFAAFDRTTGKIITSTDHGTTWTNLCNSPTGTNGAVGLAVDNARQRVFLSSNSYNYYMSTNGGTSFTTYSHSGSSVAYCDISKDMRYIARWYGSYASYSANFGDTWSAMSAPNRFVFSPDGTKCFRTYNYQWQLSSNGPAGTWQTIASAFVTNNFITYADALYISDEGKHAFASCSNASYPARYLAIPKPMAYVVDQYNYMPPSYGRNLLTKVKGSGDGRIVFGINALATDTLSAVWCARALVSL